MKRQPGLKNYFGNSTAIKLAMVLAAVLCLAASAPGSERFVDNGDGTISDNSTGLMWVKTTPALKRNLANAQSYAESASRAGYNDWRLPTREELDQLEEVFPYSLFEIKKGEYLTSSPGDPKGSIYVAKIDPMEKEMDFFQGNKRYRYCVLMVRDQTSN